MVDMPKDPFAGLVEPKDADKKQQNVVVAPVPVEFKTLPPANFDYTRLHAAQETIRSFNHVLDRRNKHMLGAQLTPAEKEIYDLALATLKEVLTPKVV